jgi:hypothetical protein
MNKHIVADMVIERLKKEIGMVPKSFPEELKILETEIPPEVFPPGGKMHMEASLYQSDKLKKITFLKNKMGEISAGSVVMIAPKDEYEIPFIVVDVTFWSLETINIFTEFDANPIFKDEESLRNYADFRKWREEIGKLPSEPITGLPEPGEFLKSCLSTINYLRFVPGEHAEELIKLTDQFFDIFIGISHKAEPVKDVQRRKKMDNFRSEYNRCALDEDPSGVMIMNSFGREKAQLFYEHLVNL